MRAGAVSRLTEGDRLDMVRVTKEVTQISVLEDHK